MKFIWKIILKQVVPSEMPQSFGVEALKAQAVAARTYALSDYLKFRYKNDGFHVKDTTEVRCIIIRLRMMMLKRLSKYKRKSFNAWR